MANHAEDSYYVPHGTRWPIIGSVGMMLMLGSAAFWVNGSEMAPWTFALGTAVIIYMMFGWFGEVIRESEAGMYNDQVDASFRMGMFWFIFSEVMFFAAFFGALFYARNMAIPWLGGESNNFFTNSLLWQNFESTWPTDGPSGMGGDYQAMPPFGLPLINTAILLTSSLTITVAHHAIQHGKRNIVAIFLALTFLLGYVFVYLQAVEYIHAYEEMNLKMTTGIYGSTFFMLTGFHGMHVTIGAIMLTVIWFRVIKGHFTPTKHFAFEATAWYWHFVDVVWIALYVFVYWL